MQHNIKCPNCNQAIDVNEIVYSQLAEKMKFDFSEKVLAEKKALEQKVRRELTEEKNNELAGYKEELQRKVEQVNEFNKTKAELERVKREKEELRSSIEVESEIKLSQLLAAEKNKIKQDFDEKNNLKLLEHQHVIDQLRAQLQDAQRKVEQGSMQIQGEVQEVALESWLKKQFPFDQIDEIKKGARGADCLQIVNSRTRQNAGKILYESKRTKNFESGWIEKLKTDMREIKADFAVLVTDVFPKGHEHLLIMDGVYVCSLSEVKGLSQALRESILLLDIYSQSQENKGDKMTMLYDYLVGNEFREQVLAIVEGFSQMQEDLLAEKRAMESIWKKREKQLQKVTLNTSHMFSSVKGIAGSSIGSIPILELPTQTE